MSIHLAVSFKTNGVHSQAPGPHRNARCVLRHWQSGSQSAAACPVCLGAQRLSWWFPLKPTKKTSGELSYWLAFLLVSLESHKQGGRNPNMSLNGFSRMQETLSFGGRNPVNGTQHPVIEWQIAPGTKSNTRPAPCLFFLRAPPFCPLKGQPKGKPSFLRVP